VEIKLLNLTLSARETQKRALDFGALSRHAQPPPKQ